MNSSSTTLALVASLALVGGGLLWWGAGAERQLVEAADLDHVGAGGEGGSPREDLEPVGGEAVVLRESELLVESPVEPAPPVLSSDAATDDPQADVWGRLFGIVRDPLGIGVAGAVVLIGDRPPRLTEEDGTFDVTWRIDEGESFEVPMPLVACFEGYGLGVVEALDRVPVRRPRPGGVQWDVGPVEILLTHGGHDLTGVLVDPLGEPCPDWSIDLFDPTLSGLPDSMLLYGGTPSVDSGGRLVMTTRGPLPWTIEEFASGQRSSRATAEDGSFAFYGLRAERSYRLRAWNRETLQSFVSRPIPPGVGDFTFVIDTKAIHADVHGIVVGVDGRPLSGVRIRLTMREREYEKDGEPDKVKEQDMGQDLLTDESGAFHFTDVPHERVFLRFRGSDVADLPYWFTSDAPVEDLRIVLLRQGRFEIDHGDLPRPDAFEVWDLAGELVAARRRGEYDPPARVQIPPADYPRLHIPPYRTTENARLLVLYLEGQEIARKDLLIVPGESVTVTF